MLKTSLQPQLLKNKQPRPLTEEELHPLTKRGFEMELKKASRKPLPERQPPKREPN